MLTVVMYHYVRDLARSRFPRIKGLDRALFVGQLDYLTRHYTMVSCEDVAAAWRQGESLPPDAALLTFDDGFTDHYDVVLPLLADRGISGAFYPVGMGSAEGRLADVHKIHFLLASVEDDRAIYQELCDLIDAARPRHDLEPLAALNERFLAPNRLGDAAETNFVKRVLQKGLPEAARSELVDILFSRHVTADQAAFAAELYLDTARLREMRQAGMHIGNHAWTHRWLAELPPEEADEEVRLADAFLTTLGVPAEGRTICYPYGNSNARVEARMEAMGYALGFSSRFELAEPGRDRFVIPRLDTNHLPKAGDAPANEWTRRIRATPA